LSGTDAHPVNLYVRAVTLLIGADSCSPVSFHEWFRVKIHDIEWRLPSSVSMDARDPVAADEPDTLLPSGRIARPIVTICGRLDSLWSACGHSAQIAQLAAPRTVTALRYLLAGIHRSPSACRSTAATPVTPRSAAACCRRRRHPTRRVRSHRGDPALDHVTAEVPRSARE